MDELRLDITNDIFLENTFVASEERPRSKLYIRKKIEKRLEKRQFYCLVLHTIGCSIYKHT